MRLTIRPIRTHDERVAAAEVMASVWGTIVEAAPLQSDLLASFADAGGSVLGAFDGDQVVGVTVAIAGRPGGRSVYSLIAAVSGSYAGRGLGLNLKLAQRDWALSHGADTIAWTYDPLIARNAHFNVNRLGARVTDFLPDFYPPMHDKLNRGDRTDRFHVEWDLRSRPVASVPADAVRVQIPHDIEALRRTDRARADDWRASTRAQFTELFDAGLRPIAFVDDAYLFAPQEDS